MKHAPVFAPRQRGFSLIELMVSLTIGLIIMLAVVSAYLGSAGAGRTAEAIGRMNEDAQMALTILSQQLRMAGVNPSQPDRSTVATGTNTLGNSVPLHNTLTNAYVLRGCDLSFSDVKTAASTGSLTCGHTASSSGPDSIAIAYEADRYNTIPTSAGVPTDCMGSGITPTTAGYTKSDNATTATATIYEAENRFFVGTSTSVVNPTLYCKGNASAYGQPLIENIEDLQLRYGTSNPAVTPTKVLGYLKAYEVDNDATTLTGLTGAASRWNAVKTVRICVVVRSENPVLDSIASAKYMNCAEPPTLVSPNDKYLRRAYTTTVVLRNK